MPNEIGGQSHGVGCCVTVKVFDDAHQIRVAYAQVALLGRHFRQVMTGHSVLDVAIPENVTKPFSEECDGVD